MIEVGSRVEILKDPSEPFGRRPGPHRFFISNFVGCLGDVERMDGVRALVRLDEPHDQVPRWYLADEIKELRTT